MIHTGQNYVLGHPHSHCKHSTVSSTPLHVRESRLQSPSHLKMTFYFKGWGYQQLRREISPLLFTKCTIAHDTVVNSERSEVSTRGAIDSIWLRKNSKMQLFTTRSSLVPSFSLHTSSWLSYPLVYIKWLQGNKPAQSRTYTPGIRLRLGQISLSSPLNAISLFLV